MSRSKQSPGHNEGVPAVFLDTNVWNRIVDGGSPLSTGTLIEAFRAGNAQVVSTLALEEELLGTARRNDAKYTKLRKIHERLAGHRSLLPLNERHVAEAKFGGVLPPDLRYNPAERRHGLRKQSRSRSELSEVNDEVYLLKKTSLGSQLAAKSDVIARFEALEADPRQAINDWFTSANIADWVDDMVRDSVERGLFELSGDEKPSIARFPSAWLLTAYAMTRIKRTIADNRKAQLSDRHDSEHCAAGAYFDVLVTEDQEFITTLQLIPQLPFEVIDPNAFAERLGR